MVTHTQSYCLEWIKSPSTLEKRSSPYLDIAKRFLKARIVAYNDKFYCNLVHSVTFFYPILSRVYMYIYPGPRTVFHYISTFIILVTSLSGSPYYIAYCTVQILYRIHYRKVNHTLLHCKPSCVICTLCSIQLVHQQ